MSEPGAAGKTFSVMGLFGSPQALLDAIPRVKAKGLGKLEAYTPYPVHGLDSALDSRKSPMGGMVLVMGVLGVIVALVLQGWTSAIDYPIVTAGKTPFSWQAFVPIVFEFTVLFAAFTAGLGMLFLLNRLPAFRHPVLRSRAIASITRDKFALAVELEGSELDVEAARAELLAAGAESIESLPFPEPLGPLSPRLLFRSLVAVGAACLVAGCATYWAVKLFPVLPPMSHMEDQPRLDPYHESGAFKDGAGMRLPPPGTVARGYLPYAIKSEDEASILTNPLPRTKEVFDRGRQVYLNHCSVCHGVTGNGIGTLTSAYGAKPANLLGQTVLEASDGKMYHAIVAGKNSMPSYAADVPEDDRWAVIHHIRALQRAQHATDADVKEALRR
jgi:cytochrome c5